MSQPNEIRMTKLTQDITKLKHYGLSSSEEVFKAFMEHKTKENVNISRYLVSRVKADPSYVYFEKQFNSEAP